MIDAPNSGNSRIRAVALEVEGGAEDVSAALDLFSSAVAVPSDAKPSASRSRRRTTLPYNGVAPAVAGSATSEAAAKRIEPLRPTKRMLVYRYILSRGAEGATRPEIAAALGMSENTVRPRVCELYAQWNTTHNCPEVKEAPGGVSRAGCAVLLAAPFYVAAYNEIAGAA